MTLNVFCFILVKVAVLSSGDSIWLAGFFSEAWQHHQILSRFRLCEIYWQSFPQHILQVTHMGASVLWQEDLVLALTQRLPLDSFLLSISLFSLLLPLYLILDSQQLCSLSGKEGIDEISNKHLVSGTTVDEFLPHPSQFSFLFASYCQ